MQSYKTPKCLPWRWAELDISASLSYSQQMEKESAERRGISHPILCFFVFISEISVCIHPLLLVESNGTNRKYWVLLCIWDVWEWHFLPLSQIPDYIIVIKNRPICPSNRLQLQKTNSTSFSAAIVTKHLCHSATVCARPLLEIGSQSKWSIGCSA